MDNDRKTLLKVLLCKLEPFIQQDTVIELCKVPNLNDISNVKKFLK